MLTQKSNMWRSALLGGALALFLPACANQGTSGPISIDLIQPAGGHCQYQVAPATLTTITNLESMQGKLGRVVTSGYDVDANPAVLNQGLGLNSLELEFSDAGRAHSALNYDSLYAASLYYAMERGFNLFASLSPLADMSRLVPNLSETTIILDAKEANGTGQRGDVKDNAEYLAQTVPGGTTRNYFLAFPTDSVSEVPLGLNLGVMVHEYTHFVFHWLYYEHNAATSDDLLTQNVLASLDEGNADYFGYLATKDPGYFLCSFPQENRDLARPKALTQEMVAAMQGDANFDPHEGGAVWAAIQYEIGNAIGPEANGRALLKMMAGLCGNGGGHLDFPGLARCHVQQAEGSQGAAMQAVYSRYF